MKGSQEKGRARSPFKAGFRRIASGALAVERIAPADDGRLKRRSPKPVSNGDWPRRQVDNPLFPFRFAAPFGALHKDGQAQRLSLGAPPGADHVQGYPGIKSLSRTRKTARSKHDLPRRKRCPLPSNLSRGKSIMPKQACLTHGNDLCRGKVYKRFPRLSRDKSNNACNCLSPSSRPFGRIVSRPAAKP